ncbi:MAG: hypothetical protein ACRC0G_03715 [Fusobacteriaceae bacterium]
MDLKELSKKWMSVQNVKKTLENSTIFDKIEFSNITKEQIKQKLAELDERVPKRNVYLESSDRDIKENWFKNWLHPKLKHFVKLPNLESYGVITEKDRQNFSELNFLRTYENGQQNFKYSLDDIEEYIK